MAGLGDFSGSGTSSKKAGTSKKAASGGLGSFSSGGGKDAPAPKDKKKGGLFGGAIRLGGSLLGEVGEFFSAPQQALFKGVRGVGQIATGDVRQGIGSLGSAGKSAAMFSLPGSSLLLEDKGITPTQALQPYGVTKLPRSLDTGLSLVADPLNVATFGTGSLAKAGLKAVAPEVAEQIAKKGVRSLSPSVKAAVRETLVQKAAAGGAKNAEKTAARQFKALSARGRGGIGVRIPGTGIGAPIIPGTALGSIGRATGATTAKRAVLDSKPVGALSRAFIPLKGVEQASGARAAEQVGEEQARRQHTASSLAEDWQKRVQAAMDDYEATTKRAFEATDDEVVHAALEAGPEAAAALRASRPELARVIDTFDAVRREQAEMQRARGLMRSEDEIRAGETARRQRPVRERIAARDAELDELNTTTDVPPVPPTAAQQRATGKLAERVRRAEATERGEVARGQRLMASAARQVERSQTRAANRTGQVIGRARTRLEEAGQLETGLAARQRQAELAAKRAEKTAKAAEKRAAKIPAPKPAKAAPAKIEAPAAKPEVMTAKQMKDKAQRIEQNLPHQTDEGVANAMRREALELRIAAAEDALSRTMAPLERDSLERFIAGERAKLDALPKAPAPKAVEGRRPLHEAKAGDRIWDGEGWRTVEDVQVSYTAKGADEATVKFTDGSTWRRYDANMDARIESAAKAATEELLPHPIHGGKAVYGRDELQQTLDEMKEQYKDAHTRWERAVDDEVRGSLAGALENLDENIAKYERALHGRAFGEAAPAPKLSVPAPEPVAMKHSDIKPGQKIEVEDVRGKKTTFVVNGLGERSKFGTVIRGSKLYKNGGESISDFKNIGRDDTVRLLEDAAAAKTPKFKDLSPKAKAEGTAAAKRSEATDARAKADELKGVKPAPSRSKVQSDVNLDAQRAHTANKVEGETVAKMAGREVERQRAAVEKAQKRLAAAKTQEQETLARLELENAQRAERAVDRRVRQLAERNVRDQDTLAKIAQDVLDDPNIITDDRYLHRIMTPEGQKALDKIEAEVRGTGGSASAALKQGSLRMRTIAREYTANQINDAIRVIHEGGEVGDVELANAVKGIAQQLEPGSKLYKESAVVSLVDRGVEAAKAIAAADYIKALRGIADDTGRAILLSADDAASLKMMGEELADDLVEFKLGKFGTFYAPKAVKAEIVGAMGRLDDPDGLSKALDSADKWWRSQVTASLPGGVPFATRNARSNVMLMWLSGTNVLKYMKEGAKLQRAVGRVYKAHAADVADLGVEAAMRKHLDPRQFKLWDYARKSGITGDAFYTVELGGTAPGIKVKGAAKDGRLPRRAVRAAFGTQGAAAQKGRQLNETVEQHARLSQFLADVDRLGDLEEAARRTKDVLFDYSALTPTEKKIKRWGMPFYTFARKNIPGQVRRFIEAPGRFVVPEKLATATTDPLPEGSPEYQERQGSRLSKVPGLLGMVTTPERPLHAAAKTLDPFFQLAAGRGQLGLRGIASNLGGVPGAPAKSIFEQATGTSVFTGYKLPQSAADRQKLAAQTVLPSLGRQPFGAYLPTATPSQTKKRQAPNLAKALSVLGVGLQPVNEKELKRQGRLAKAAKQAERG